MRDVLLWFLEKWATVAFSLLVAIGLAGGVTSWADVVDLILWPRIIWQGVRESWRASHGTGRRG